MPNVIFKGTGASPRKSRPLATKSPTTVLRDCSTTHLSMALVHGGVAAGTVGAYLRFTNIGKSECRLSGWPVVRGAPANSRPARHVRQTLQAGAADTIPMELLAPGASAVSAITAGNESRSGQACAFRYDTLSVTPPHQHRSATISAYAPNYGYVPACIPLAVTPIVRAASVPV